MAVRIRRRQKRPSTAASRLEAGSDRQGAARPCREDRLRVQGRSLRRPAPAFHLDGLARCADERVPYPPLRPTDGDALSRRDQCRDLALAGEEAMLATAREA